MEKQIENFKQAENKLRLDLINFIRGCVGTKDIRLSDINYKGIQVRDLLTGSKVEYVNEDGVILEDGYVDERVGFEELPTCSLINLWEIFYNQEDN